MISTIPGIESEIDERDSHQCEFHFLLGVALDSVDGKDICIIKKQGKVKALEDEIFYRKCILEYCSYSRRTIFDNEGNLNGNLNSSRYQYRFRVENMQSRGNRAYPLGDPWCPIRSEFAPPEVRQRPCFRSCAQW